MERMEKEKRKKSRFWKSVKKLLENILGILFNLVFRSSTLTTNFKSNLYIFIFNISPTGFPYKKKGEKRRKGRKK